MRKTFPLTQNKKDNNDTILELNEYIITKDNTPIGIYIAKLKDNVQVRSISYELKLTSKNFKLDDLSFSSIDDLYLFIKNLLEEKKVTIKEISDKMMKVILAINNKKFEISLKKSKETNSSIINEIFNKYSTFQENINTFNRKTQRLKENENSNENNKQLNSDFDKNKNDISNIKTQNEDKMDDIIDNESDKTDKINNVKKGGKTKLISSLNDQSSLSKSQRLKSTKNMDESPNKKDDSKNKNEKSPKDNKKKEKSEENNTKDQKFMEQFDEEQLFKTQEDRIIL